MVVGSKINPWPTPSIRRSRCTVDLPCLHSNPSDSFFPEIFHCINIFLHFLSAEYRICPCLIVTVSVIYMQAVFPLFPTFAYSFWSSLSIFHIFAWSAYLFPTLRFSFVNRGFECTECSKLLWNSAYCPLSRFTINGKILFCCISCTTHEGATLKK